MLTKDDLEQLGKLIEQKLATERQHTRKLVHEEVEAAEQRLTKKIEASQEDTIEILKELIHTGYTCIRSALATLKSI